MNTRLVSTRFLAPFLPAFLTAFLRTFLKTSLTTCRAVMGKVHSPIQVSKRCLIVVIAVFLSACSQGPEHDLSTLPKITLEANLLDTYKRTCANCHELAATGAPQTGDIPTWQEVFDKPFEQILDRAINGYEGMPPLGQCFECSQEDLSTLIHYMSRPQL